MGKHALAVPWHLRWHYQHVMEADVCLQSSEVAKIEAERAAQEPVSVLHCTFTIETCLPHVIPVCQ